MMKMNNFRGDLTDASADTTALLQRTQLRDLLERVEMTWKAKVGRLESLLEHGFHFFGIDRSLASMPACALPKSAEHRYVSFLTSGSFLAEMSVSSP